MVLCYIIFMLERRYKYVCDTVQLFAPFLNISAMVESWKELNTSNVFTSLIVR